MMPQNHNFMCKFEKHWGSVVKMHYGPTTGIIKNELTVFVVVIFPAAKERIFTMSAVYGVSIFARVLT